MKPTSKAIRTAMVSNYEKVQSAISNKMCIAMLNYMPLRGVPSFGSGAIDFSMIDDIFEQLNKT